MSPPADAAATTRPWPAAVDELISSAAGRSERSWTPTGSESWSDGAMDVVRLASAARCANQVDLLARLAEASVPAPTVVGTVDAWLVTSRPQGRSAGEPDHHPDPDDLVVAVGRGLRLLHDVDPTALGEVLEETSGWQTVADRCRRAVEAGAVETGELPSPYDRYQPERLLELLIEGRPAAEERVLCHGGPVMARFLVHRGSFVGFDRLDSALIADHHLDLAAIHLDLQQLMGPEAVFRFYDAYRTDPDLVRLDHYLLANHLLASAGPGSNPTDADHPERS